MPEDAPTIITFFMAEKYKFKRHGVKTKLVSNNSKYTRCTDLQFWDE
jgi:hypothetical protein